MVFASFFFFLFSFHYEQSRPAEGETVFEIETSKRNQLPIKDFAPFDFVEKKQKFGFQAGPVCFL